MSLLVLAALLARAPAAPQRHLLVDDAIVASARNMAIAPGPVRKYPGNPLFGEEFPWEPRFDNMYPTVIWDREERAYRCWYNLFVIFHRDPRTATPEKETWSYRESGVAYATSRDGIHWRKPLFPEFPFDGRPSNVLLRDVHGAGVFKDERDPDPARRYKMVLRREEHGEARGFASAFSADGIHWSEPVEIANIRLKADTHNNALWAPELDRYVAFSRDWGPPVGKLEGRIVSGIANARDRVRLVARTESPDFVHWSDSRVVLRGGDDAHQVYAMPVCRDGGVYFGLPVILDVHTDRAWTELAWSRDTIHWRRIRPGTPLIGNGPPGSFDWGCVYPSPPVFGPGQIRIYYGGSDATHTGERRTHLGLALLGPGRLAGAAPEDPARPAEIETRPLPPSGGGELLLTADIAEGGSIEVSLRRPGRAGWTVIGRVEGRRLLTREPLRLGLPPSELSSPLRFRFILEKAILYSLEL